MRLFLLLINLFAAPLILAFSFGFVGFGWILLGLIIFFCMGAPSDEEVAAARTKALNDEKLKEIL